MKKEEDKTYKYNNLKTETLNKIKTPLVEDLEVGIMRCSFLP
jgi:hypothetical protein